MKNVVIVGGGIAGVETACALAECGNRVTIIEKSDKIGGKLNRWYCLFPDFKKASDLKKYLEEKISKFDIDSVKYIFSMFSGCCDELKKKILEENKYKK